MSKTGILILAVGKPSYQSLAVNLAISLRAGGGDKVPVALVTDNPEGIMDRDWSLFDKVIKVDESNPYLIKTQIYDLTPFKSTLYIDADSLWNPDFSLPDFLSMLEANEAPLGLCLYPEIERGQPAKLEWIEDLTDLRVHYELIGPYRPVQSSVIYFRRRHNVATTFKKLKAIYGTYPKMQSFRGFHPDEPYFSLAVSDIGAANFSLMPYVGIIQGPKLNRSELLLKHILTFPGERHPDQVRQFYGAVARQGWNQMGNGYELRK